MDVCVAAAERLFPPDSNAPQHPLLAAERQRLYCRLLCLIAAAVLLMAAA
eukprot:CAMPEP_0172695738 /NCGR_PEP_ID=MMETSP1074-20121228/27570_1 /TAXON_ID=2916 /ORGANISM="Ceratium fusus, Strain PA161109" /LENGTH=49 /DNA_ID= /DNA_START= /DNA_END= /DNA_ORIENTATION=